MLNAWFFGPIGRYTTIEVCAFIQCSLEHQTDVKIQIRGRKIERDSRVKHFQRQDSGCSIDQVKRDGRRANGKSGTGRQWVAPSISLKLPAYLYVSHFLFHFRKIDLPGVGGTGKVRMREKQKEKGNELVRRFPPFPISNFNTSLPRLNLSIFLFFLPSDESTLDQPQHRRRFHSEITPAGKIFNPA